MPWPYTASSRVSTEPALIDDWLPEGAWRLEHHALEIPVSPELALDVLGDLREGDIPVVRALMSMRGIPIGRSRTLRDYFTTPPFVTLAEEPGRELVGAIPGPFWHFGRGRMPADIPRTAEEFRSAFAGGRMAAIANFRADPLPVGGSLLWSETWAYAPKGVDNRQFTAYWLAVGPFSALIRRVFLSAARRKAELAARGIMSERSDTLGQ